MPIPRRRDHYVKFLREETIEARALAARRAAGTENLSHFDLTDFVERLAAAGLKTGPLCIQFFSMKPGDDPAYVEFKDDPIIKAKFLTILNIDIGIWEDAKLGEPNAKYILAHEIGHIILHDNEAKAYSGNNTEYVSFSRIEFSAEWQANTFADYFLLPTHIVASIDNLTDIISSCSVTNELAKRRLLSVRKLKCRSSAYEGEACGECGNFTLVRSGTCLKCDTCGGTTGCS